MFQYLKPNLQIVSFQGLDDKWLKKHGVQLLICDIDNTLSVHDEPLPSQEVIDFITHLKAQGFKLCLISNNRKERVKQYGEALGVKAYAFALKPMKHTYRRILNDFHVEACECACLGDQLLTDGLGAKRMKMLMILSQPLSTKDIIYTRLNRCMERWILKQFEKRKENE